MIRVLLLFCLLHAALAQRAQCASVPQTNIAITVRWTFAQTNVDGSALTDLAGAKVYYGTASSNYTVVVDVPGGEPGGEGHCTISNLVAGRMYYFNGTAYNTAGLESDFCNEVAKSANRPGAMIRLDVQHAHSLTGAWNTIGFFRVALREENQ